jgi:hypothetical protein
MPTLLHIKPSSVVSVNKKFFSDRAKFFTGLVNEINYFDCNYSVLYEDEKVLFLMVYHSQFLYQVLMQDQNRPFLNDNGYCFYNYIVENSIKRLQIRYIEFMEDHKEFPHELGILLGYPIEDVEGYIKNNGQNYLFSGFWKVYHDIERAEKVFESFRMVREAAMEIIYSGRELRQLENSFALLNAFTRMN